MQPNATAKLGSGCVTRCGPIVSDHVSEGGTRGSWWRVVAISFLWLLAILAGVVGVILVLTQVGVSIE